MDRRRLAWGHLRALSIVTLSAAVAGSFGALRACVCVCARGRVRGLLRQSVSASSIPQTADHIVNVAYKGGRDCSSAVQKSKQTAMLLLCIAGGPPAERIYLGYTTLGFMGVALLTTACVVPLATCVTWLGSRAASGGTEAKDAAWCRPCVPKECLVGSILLYVCGFFILGCFTSWAGFDLFLLLTDGMVDAKGCKLGN